MFYSCYTLIDIIVYTVKANNREGKTLIDLRAEHEQDNEKNDLQRMEAPKKRSEHLEENSNQNMSQELATPTGSQSTICRTMLDAMFKNQVH